MSLQVTNLNRALALVVGFRGSAPTPANDAVFASYKFTTAVTLLGWRLASCLVNTNATVTGYCCLVHGSSGDPQVSGRYVYPPQNQQTRILDQHNVGPNVTPNSGYTVRSNTAYAFDEQVLYVIEPGDFVGITQAGGSPGDCVATGSVTLFYRRNLS